MNEKVEQHNHFVAFIDLLGYKDFFKDNRHNVEKFLTTIDKALTSAVSETESYYAKIPTSFKPQIKLFSDNILIAIRCSRKNEDDFLPYLNLVRIVAKIQATFINKYQLFLRGGIAKGMFYFGEKYVFGEALINAYEMEQIAIYPKIVLETKHIEKIISHIKSRGKGYDLLAKLLTAVVGKERDGSYFVNYLPAFPMNEKNPENYFIESIFAEGFEQKSFLSNEQKLTRDDNLLALHRDALLEKLQEYGSYDTLFSLKDIENRRKVILKYMWSLDYHNQASALLNYHELIIHCDIKTDSRTLQPVVEVLKG